MQPRNIHLAIELFNLAVYRKTALQMRVASLFLAVFSYRAITLNVLRITHFLGVTRVCYSEFPTEMQTAQITKKRK